MAHTCFALLEISVLFALACSRLSDSGEDAKVQFPLVFFLVRVSIPRTRLSWSLEQAIFALIHLPSAVLPPYIGGDLV